jgi:hypothetical protein
MTRVCFTRCSGRRRAMASVELALTLPLILSMLISLYLERDHARSVAGHRERPVPGHALDDAEARHEPFVGPFQPVDLGLAQGPGLPYNDPSAPDGLTPSLLGVRSRGLPADGDGGTALDSGLGPGAKSVRSRLVLLQALE